MITLPLGTGMVNIDEYQGVSWTWAVLEAIAPCSLVPFSFLEGGVCLQLKFSND